MFDGVPVDYLHDHFTSSSSTTPLLSINHHAFTNFDPFSNSSTQQLHQNFLHDHKNEGSDNKQHQDHDDDDKGNNLVVMNSEIQLVDNDDPWSSDEVLALLRIRSTMDNSWEHVSRKLAQLGFKRSADKCKEKFEEESSTYFNANINEAVHMHDQQQVISSVKNKKTDKPTEDTIQNPRVDEIVIKRSKKRKFREKNKFEVFKYFFEDIVHKLMAQQEEMNNKLIEVMVKRDEENFLKEEAWRMQEMEKSNKEIEMRAHEQAIACDRQRKIINFLKSFSPNFSTSSSSFEMALNPNPPANNVENSGSGSSQVRNFSSTHDNPGTLALNPLINNTQFQNPSMKEKNPNSNDIGDEIGKRWPKDEVLSLINIRCHINGEDKELGGGGAATCKAPLWERISQGMFELGYKRSAKRCKEKWENINKYFRKTKHVNKKRSLEDRTCPYFQQLSTLYNQAQNHSLDRIENQPSLPESGGEKNVSYDAGEEQNIAQAPDFEFEI